LRQRNNESAQLHSVEVTVAGQPIRLSFETQGDVSLPAVLLLHGWGSSAALMRPIAEWLSPRFFVINLDLPGHGRSPVPPAAWGVPEHAELVRNVAERLIDGPYAIVGHSNGGRIALYLASESHPPAFLTRLALISPSGVRRKRSSGYYVRRYTAIALKAPFQALPSSARDFCLDWLRHSLVWRLLGSSDYANVEGVMRETFVKTVNCYLEERLPRVYVPALIFRGDRDDAVTREQMAVLEKAMPDAGFVEVPGAGHYAFIDRPDLVRAGLIQFLADT